jgi:hypothetical protein
VFFFDGTTGGGGALFEERDEVAIDFSDEELSHPRSVIAVIALVKLEGLGEVV